MPSDDKPRAYSEEEIEALRSIWGGFDCGEDHECADKNIARWLATLDEMRGRAEEHRLTSEARVKSLAEQTFRAQKAEAALDRALADARAVAERAWDFGFGLATNEEHEREAHIQEALALSQPRAQSEVEKAREAFYEAHRAVAKRWHDYRQVQEGERAHADASYLILLAAEREGGF